MKSHTSLTCVVDLDFLKTETENVTFVTDSFCHFHFFEDRTGECDFHQRLVLSILFSEDRNGECDFRQRLVLSFLFSEDRNGECDLRQRLVLSILIF